MQNMSREQKQEIKGEENYIKAPLISTKTYNGSRDGSRDTKYRTRRMLRLFRILLAN